MRDQNLFSEIGSGIEDTVGSLSLVEASQLNFANFEPNIGQ